MINDIILNKKIKVFVYATGAGSGLQKRLWEIPGCSSFLVGCGFPYDIKKTEKILGYKPESFVSKETSIELAMAAYMEAYDPSDDVEDVIGIGVTASVASIKSHRGDHRVVATAISNKGCVTISAILKKGEGKKQRIIDGNIVDDLAESLIASVLDIPAVADTGSWIFNVENVDQETLLNEDLINLIMKRPYFKVDGTKGLFNNKENNINLLFYPGTFNPFHFGHSGAAAASKVNFIKQYHLEPEVIYSTCINPKHKAPPTITDILQKVSQMKGRNFLLTKDDALYLEKARANPGTSFIVGADALLTMLDPKWGHNINNMLEEFVNLHVDFYVVGRAVNDEFLTLDTIKNRHPILNKYNYQFKHVEGRWDISSTQLRLK